MHLPMTAQHAKAEYALCSAKFAVADHWASATNASVIKAWGRFLGQLFGRPRKVDRRAAGPESSNIEPMFAKDWPESGQLWPSSDQVAQVGANFDQPHSVKVGSNPATTWAKVSFFEPDERGRW